MELPTCELPSEQTRPRNPGPANVVCVCVCFTSVITVSSAERGAGTCLCCRVGVTDTVRLAAGGAWCVYQICSVVARLFRRIRFLTLSINTQAALRQPDSTPGDVRARRPLEPAPRQKVLVRRGTRIRAPRRWPRARVTHGRGCRAKRIDQPPRDGIDNVASEGILGSAIPCLC